MAGSGSGVIMPAGKLAVQSDPKEVADVLRLWIAVMVLALAPGSVTAVEESVEEAAARKAQATLDSLLIASVRNAELDSVKALLKKGAEPSAKDEAGITAFQHASKKCNLDVVTVMRGGPQALQEIRKSKLSMWGTGRIYDEMVLAMLAEGVNQEPPVKPGDNKALLMAAIYGQSDRIPVLLEAGANVDAQSKGRTALIWAAFWGHAETVKVLLEGGADIQSRDATGNTAFHWASQLGHKEAAELIRKEAERRLAAKRDSITKASSRRAK